MAQTIKKLHNKDFSISIKFGTDHTKFAKECVKGELFFDTNEGSNGRLYFATEDAGDGTGANNDAVLKYIDFGGTHTPT